MMCSEFSRCYNDVNICLWTNGAEKTRAEAESYCTEKQPNSFLPRITNIAIQNRLKEFRIAANSPSAGNLLENKDIWIDVHTTAIINDFHWIDGSSLTGHFIYEFAGILVL